MKRIFLSSTYSKLVITIIITSFMFSIFFGLLFYNTIIQEKKVNDSSKKQFKNEIVTLLHLNSESYKSYITDATFWDEFVNFFKTKTTCNSCPILSINNKHPTPNPRHHLKWGNTCHLPPRYNVVNEVFMVRACPIAVAPWSPI